MNTLLVRWLLASAAAHAALFALAGPPQHAPSPMETTLRIELASAPLSQREEIHGADAPPPLSPPLSSLRGRVGTAHQRPVSRSPGSNSHVSSPESRVPSPESRIPDASPPTPGPFDSAQDRPRPPASAPDPREPRLRLLISRWIAGHFAYPPLARRRGFEGEVRLAVRVEADGRLSQIALARSSGHRLLDAAALASARSIPPLVQAVALLAGSALDTVVPIRYRLTEG